MADVLQFAIDDTSPSISYYPFGDTFSSPNLTAGWNPYFTDSGFAAFPGQTGNGTSLHITSLDGASLSIQWNGTGIQLLGNTTGQASYTITLDGNPAPVASSSANNILATYANLTNTLHTISLTAQTNAPPNNDSFIAFDKALITAAAPSDASNSNFSTQSMPDSDIAFLGRWTYQRYNYSSGPDPYMHMSSTANDRAQISFRGTALTLTGMLSPSSGAFSVTLDNVTTKLSARSSFATPDALLFFATGLDESSTHTVQVENDDGSLFGLEVGGMNVTGDSNPEPTSIPAMTSATTSSSYPSGTIAALCLAGVLILLIFGGLLLYFLVYRPRRRRRRARRRQECISHKAEEVRGPRPPPSAIDVIDISPRGGDDDMDADELDNTTVTHELGYKATLDDVDGENEKHSSVDFNLDPTLYTEGLGSQSRAGSKSRSSSQKSNGKGKTPKRSSYTFDLPIPAIFRSRTPSRHSRSSSSNNSQPQQAQPPPPSQLQLQPPSPGFGARSPRSSVATAGHSHTLPQSHTRDGSRGLLLGPESPADEDPETEGIERTLGPRISNAASAIINVIPPSRPRTAESLGPRVSFGPRERTSKVLAQAASASKDHGNVAPKEHRDAPQAPIPSAGDKIAEQESPVDSEGQPFLNVRSSSPFKVDFVPVSRRGSRGVRRTQQQQVQFDLAERSDKSQEQQATDLLKEEEPVQTEVSQPPLPLTPLVGEPRSSAPTRLNRQNSESTGGLSFLDFSSRASSLRTRPTSSDTFSSSYPSQRGQTRSRWSATTGTAPSLGAVLPPEAPLPSSPDTQNSSTIFPFPVSLPSSPHHPPGAHTHTPLHLQPSVYHHPAVEAFDPTAVSPTESVPMSVSDIYFRHTDSDSGGVASRRTSTGSHLPPHPPLPPPSPPATAALGAPPYIVQRVLGMASNAPGGAWSAPVSPQAHQLQHGRTASIQDMLGNLNARNAPGSSDDRDQRR